MRILVIEDSPTTSALLAEEFRGRGHEVATAASAWCGLEKALDFRPDAVLCDLMLPDLPAGDAGDRLPRLLKKALPAARVVGLTAFGDGDFARAEKQLAARGVPLLRKGRDLDAARVLAELEGRGSAPA